MKINRFILFIIIVVLSVSCRKEQDLSEFLLLSDKEAPLGWSYFTVYKDSTFEFITRGLVNKNVFSGKARIMKDTIYLNYNDSIPVVGTKVFLTEKYIEFVDFHNVKFMTRLNNLIK